MLHHVLFAFWFLLPAALANVTPILVAVVPGLRRWQAPMDGGRIFRGKRLLGTHKTWRGLVSGTLVATLVLGLQQLAYRDYAWAHTVADGVNYNHLPLFLGALFGLGALGGDALESFFKRQKNIESGKTWIPFDQLDYIVGGLLLSLPCVILSASQYIIIVVIWFIVHVVASYIGWMLDLKEQPI